MIKYDTLFCQVIFKICNKKFGLSQTFYDLMIKGDYLKVVQTPILDDYQPQSRLSRHF